jgi:hypothetical protein
MARDALADLITRASGQTTPSSRERRARDLVVRLGDQAQGPHVKKAWRPLIDGDGLAGDRSGRIVVAGDHQVERLPTEAGSGPDGSTTPLRA